MPYYSQLVISWLLQAVGRSIKKQCVEHLSSLSLKYLLHSHTLPVFYVDGPVPKSQFSLLRAKRHDCPRQLVSPSLGASGVVSTPIRWCLHLFALGRLGSCPHPIWGRKLVCVKMELAETPRQLFWRRHVVFWRQQPFKNICMHGGWYQLLKTAKCSPWLLKLSRKKCGKKWQKNKISFK